MTHREVKRPTLAHPLCQDKFCIYGSSAAQHYWTVDLAEE